ncbi:DUF3408 domain-containing protein [Chryseobacterium indologenes]|uniref:DUF3408 domain-containing protein n=1 Tax=Chryseobacterium indologenes TaxID=253 RepID=A0AAD0YU72_CHRID|nr:DUF3408 domain-containing protein [Chryseobacterium indologenes]AZB17498.1 DUF3408 domain-containing protein [Chryseobacterium indologenes]
MKKTQNKVEVTIKVNQETGITKGTYEKLFLDKKNMEKRGEKSIYLREEYHQRLSRIAQIIGGDKIPLYAYLDNILSHHFDLFESMIIEEFEANCKPLF